MIAFTICSKNFMAYALTLHDSLRANDDALTFYVALCDDLDGLDVGSLPFEVISLSDLGIPDLQEMIKKYSITELNTSIKPFAFLYLFDRHPGETVVYLDPDILVTSPLAELKQVIDEGANCVLTPHILQPAEFADMDDGKFLIYGIYNLGFCALRGTPEVHRVVSWWARRLETKCVIDLPNGLFVDQKWADLLPSFIDRTVILRHPGYNVAYWNLSQRQVRLESVWTVNGEALRFVHFSGNNIADSAVFSRHSTQFNTQNIGDLSLLLADYRQKILAHGHDYYSSMPYAFDWDGATGMNAHAPKALVGQRKAAISPPYLPVLRFRSLLEFNNARDRMATVITVRNEAEKDAIPYSVDAFRLHGFCACCGHESEFQVSGMYSSKTLDDGRVVPNWREHLNCLECGLVNRVRASLHLLRQEFAPSPDDAIYVTEQITPTYAWLKRRFPNTQGSEYFVGKHRSGDLIDGILHQDVQQMSFPDDVFDHILTFDVLEHVPDHGMALREFFRCLKPGGRLMVTVPFRWTSQTHQIRAELRSNGEIEHFMEPEYHGNPVDMEAGALCFRYFGWQLLDELREIGFTDAEVIFYWSEQLRHFGDPQLVIAAKK
jgi:hypothetical protein